MEKLKHMKMEWVVTLLKIKKRIQNSSTWINHPGSAGKNEVLQSWIQSIIKACFHMSGKSQTIGNFTVSKLSQVLSTNENSKSQISPIVWDGRGQIWRIGSVSIFPTRPRFLRWSVIIPDKWKFKSLPSGTSAMDFTHYQSPKLLGSSPPNRDRLLAIIRYIGSLRSRRLEVVGTRKKGRARRRHARGEEALACLPCARPLSLSPATSKRLRRRLIYRQNPGCSAKSKISDRLGFSRHMKTRLY